MCVQRQQNASHDEKPSVPTSTATEDILEIKVNTYIWKGFWPFCSLQDRKQGTGHFSNNKTGQKQQASRHNAQQQNRKNDTVTYSISYEDSYMNSRTTKEVTATSNICHLQARDIWVFAAAFLSRYRASK
jgi:hypothetical protein